MNRARVDRAANAVLYEGYILYPYRPSVKNRQRWTFGGLYPELYCIATKGSETSSNRTELLVRGTPETAIEVVARFLHLTDRQVGRIHPPLDCWPAEGGPAYRLVDSLRVGDRVISTWQEAEEREVAGGCNLQRLLKEPLRVPFSFPSRRWLEPLSSRGTSDHNGDGFATSGGKIAGVLVRQQHAVEGEVEVSAEPAVDGLYRLTARTRNLTQLDMADDREAALLRSFASAHLLLGVRSGEFVSLLDPPNDCLEVATNCRQTGLWPVLVGDEGSADAMLASPIILYDYPQVAPESPGDLFDATEIDEILTLRILTLTDEEKRQVAGVDDRARALLARSESLSEADMASLHGTMRSPR